jgi:WD40 repeat protein
MPPKPEQQKQNPLRIAVSEDLSWELLRGKQKKEFILKQIGKSTVSYLFRTIKWNHYFTGTGTGSKTAEQMTESSDMISDPQVPYIGTIKDNYVVIYAKNTGDKITHLFGHEDAVSAMVFNENGRFALTGSLDRTLRLWELPSGRCLRTFTSLGGAVDSVHFGKNSRFALSLIAGGSLRLWDISVLCSETPFRAPLLLSNIASSEEVSQQQSEMNQYCGKIKETVKNSNFADAVAVYKKLSSMSNWESSRNQLESEGVLDILSRRTVRKSLMDVLCTQSFTGHQDVITTAALSLDGNLAATAGRDNTIRIWNLDKNTPQNNTQQKNTQQKNPVVLEGHYDWVRSIALTMDSKFIVSGSWDMSVRVWNIRSGQCLRQFEEKIKSLTKIALNPQGRIVAIANGQGTVILWDVLTDNITGRFLAHNGSVNSLRFSRNGHYLITGGDDNKVCIWRIGYEEPVRVISAHNAPVTEAVLSTDLSTLVSADREGRIIAQNLIDDRLEYDLQGHFGDITGLELLADDRFFLSAAKDKKIRCECPANPSVQRIIEGHPAPVLCLAADIAGKRCITGCEDAVVRVWDLYWNYDYFGQTDLTPQAVKVLKTLLSLYSPDAANEKPKIDDTILKRIFLEMEYRGYGTIPQEQLRTAVQDITENWKGTETLHFDR